MKLVDDVVIEVEAGNGGDGATITKQMYSSKKTMPDGGNGGNGGSVYFKADRNISDLSQFQYKKKIKGIDGTQGKRKDLDGKNGDDITVLVPFGTTILNKTTKEHVELTTDLPFQVATGGTGGMGNHDYKPDLKKFGPRIHEGTKGDAYTLHLTLRLIADVGLVGLPNAGKSSILEALTNATPKIANYPFTTLSPNLGVCKDKVIADIPGLIEGASEGKGIGISFLKHISKTRILLHCIDSTESDIEKSYNLVRHEFAEFDKALLEKEEIILLTKIDLQSEKALKEQIKKLKATKRKVVPVSIYDEKSIESVMDLILSFD